MLWLLATLWRVACVAADQAFYQVFFRFDTRASGLLAGALLAALLHEQPDFIHRARRHLHHALWLPLAVPLLIFATAACQAAAAGLPVSGYLAMLAAFLTASATLCPFATAAALRLTVR